MKTVSTMLALVLWLPALALAAGKDVAYTVGKTIYEGYFAEPKAKQKTKQAPLVFMVHDWDGLTDYEKKRADMLSDQGYAVFVADLFGKGVRPSKIEDRKQHTGELYADRAKMRQLLSGALAAAQQQGANVSNAVAMGYCFGGAAVLELARSGASLQGFITVHAGLKTPEGQDYKRAKGEYLIQHGAADQVVTIDELRALGQQLEAADLNYELIAYGGAPHAWTVFGSDSYREQADRRAWERQLDFLQEVLEKN